MKTAKYFIITLLFIFFNNHSYSQKIADSLVVPGTPLNSLADTAKPVNRKKVKILTDTVKRSYDTLQPAAKLFIKSYHSVVDSLLLSNKFIDLKRPGVYFLSEEKQPGGKEFIFYTLCVVILILGLFKTLYKSYFNNLFRVFFNTSIRQTQLADQLLQAKLPSFILNIFFAISAGIFVWLLFKYYHPPRLITNRLLLPFCIAGVGILYFIKYCFIKFLGWMSGMQQAADNYIFVIFLINKITGIILIPFIVLLAFAMPLWINSIALFSVLVIGLFFLSRYVKIFGILEYRFPLQPFHFLIYITGVEVLPILIIYKLVVDYVI
ncbi:MAG: DUF4271 domain-containing protein [Bacteroidota bacterium]|nr:DUF4271 domain-containing protein [Bacteroidota bacterium]